MRDLNRHLAPRALRGQKRAEHALAGTQAVLQDVLTLNQKIISASPVGVLAFHYASGRCVLANQAAADLASMPVEELLNLGYQDLPFLEEEGLLDLAAEVVASGLDRQVDLHRINAAGREVFWVVHLSLFREHGQPHVLALVQDVTERRLTEAALARVQKMESLGLMAGGIAHDFNNHFQVILACLERAERCLGEPSQVAAALAKARLALDKSVDMAQRMLDYSGKGFRQAAALDLSEMVLDNADFLQEMVPPRIALEVKLAEGLPPVEGDPTQLAQVVAALVLNAVEAIVGAGVITLASSEVRVDSGEADAEAWVVRPRPGPAVALAVADSGEGMDREVLAKAFDPFFSTRAPGRGLGLPAALGIVQAHQGGLQVASAPGRGTTVTVLLPLAGAVPEPALPAAGGPPAPALGRTLLVVDDDPDIRANLAEILTTVLGYQVLVAGDGDEAVRLYRRHPGGIALVLMDATMGRMTGAEAFELIKRINPAARALLCSGFSAETGREMARAHGFVGFLKKPFRIADLQRALGEALGEPEAAFL